MIHYLPIDLPKLESSEMFSLDGFVESKNPYYGLHLNAFDVHNKEWHPIMLKNWFFVKEYIEKYLPIKKFYIVRISKQLMDIGKHYDYGKPNNISGVSDSKETIYNKELADHYDNLTSPYGYRLVLEGRNNILTIHNNSAEYESKLPVFTNCYCINSIETKHSTKMDDNRWVVFIHGWLDEKRHDELINRSLIKYKDYVIAF